MKDAEALFRVVSSLQDSTDKV
jgi:flagellar biosynthesis GTPase FlhF